MSGGFGLAINAMVAFLLPLRAAELGASVGVIGVIVGAGAVLPSVLSVPLGSLSDRIGARRVLQLGTAGTVLAGLGMAAATEWWMLLALQLVQGPCRAGGWVSSQSYVTSVGDDRDRARNAGRFSFVTNASRMVAPLLVGGVAAGAGLRAGFLVVAAYAAVFVVVATALPDAGRHAGERPSGGVGAVVALLRRRWLRIVLALTFARLWISVVFTSFSPLYLVDRGVSPAVAGAVLALSAAVGTAFTLLAPRLAARTSGEAVTAVGLACGAAGLALVPVLGPSPAYALAAVLVGVGEGLSLPLLIALIGEHADPGQRGLAVGLRVSANQAANALAPMAVGGLVASTGVGVGFPVGGLTALVILAVAMAWHLSERRRRPS